MTFAGQGPFSNKLIQEKTVVVLLRSCHGATFIVIIYVIRSVSQHLLPIGQPLVFIDTAVLLLQLFPYQTRFQMH